MYQILVAEDEPPIMRYLVKIIETKCTGFEVAATAENGSEALEKIRSMHVDLVLTDAKMPFMDGIELISKLNVEYPNILTVVISGYQDFQYVKQAFKSGAQDYLLKPVQSSQMCELLSALSVKLDSIYYQSRQEQLESILYNMPFATEKPIDQDFKEFLIAIIRKNGLPSRFCSKQHVVASYLFNDFDVHGIQALFSADGVWLIEGRDDNESIVISGYKTQHMPDYARILGEIVQKMSVPHAFFTIAYDYEFTILDDFKEKTEKLYNILDQAITTGENRAVCSETSFEAMDGSPIMDGALQNKLEYLVASKAMPQLKQELVKLFSQWEAERRPQVWVEKMVRQFLHIAEKSILSTNPGSSADMERMLDEALFYSTTFGELLASIWDMIDEIMTNRQIDNAQIKKDTEGFLDSVEQYLKKNLSQMFSLQSVCDDFGISQTYLSRMFRRYKDTSFNEYVTLLRINEAKRIMAENPEILLKDVACIVGYKDPYYFSRVFKSVTGCPPSAYSNT
jgi:two-component system, response regulator YesN